ncbi:hypothetical protein [Xanthomonas translucens]|uniref:hypothetical protein n=1 Tax=Xanthomonas campestris pv. translucens TaxID=343 RepID=UPI00064218F1|nr:hypothetical protein [Xanthomonas translucens]AKK67476.1 hypothetical protein FD63_08300 [Xanthomonas translucens pv. undulosa]MCT8270857.1 hypothetical protein [Xanthomonas translucens pv. undulosa]UJB16653.1 hypothetical protein LTC53_08570 [Xanthomonas translucens pv. undulosa]
MLSSVAQLAATLEGRFVFAHWHNVGADHERTLQAWRDNGEACLATAACAALRAAFPARVALQSGRMRSATSGVSGACGAPIRPVDGQLALPCARLWQRLLSPEGVPRRYRAPC